MLRRLSLKLLAGSIIAALLLFTLPQLCPPAYAAGEDEPECWAVLVGISEYKMLSDLDYSDDGAEELYQLLSPAWGEEHIRMLTDQAATKSEIRQAISWLVSQADENDTVLLFFSMHSDSGGYLSTYDAYFEHTWISDDELKSWLRPLAAEKTVIILDTCYAGQYQSSLGADGRVILMSSQSNEYSWETASLEHSVFTCFVLEAIDEFGAADSNLDYELSAEEVFQYAEPLTVLATSDFEDIQHPVISDEYPGELSLLAQLVINISPSLPSGLDIVTLDGQSYSSNPLEITLVPGTSHELNLTSPLDIGGGTRYVFSRWDDSDDPASRTISSGGDYTAYYRTQYQMVIQSEFGQPQGAGWYDSGSPATISVQSIEEPTIRYIFTGWSGDYTSTADTASIIMNSPQTVTANWRTDYLLTIESAYGHPSGAGWYTDSSIATASVPSSIGLGIRHIFTGWSGDCSGNVTTTSLTMDSPKTITANWRTDYTQLYIFFGAQVAAAGITLLIRAKIRRRIS